MSTATSRSSKQVVVTDTRRQEWTYTITYLRCTPGAVPGWRVQGHGLDHVVRCGEVSFPTPANIIEAACDFGRPFREGGA